MNSNKENSQGLEIYLDSNIYISIANREKEYEYIVAKMNNLKHKGVIFPHAPPHAEEISARINSDRGLDTAKRFIKLLIRFNGGFGYLPGIPNQEETQEIINTLNCLAYKNPSLKDAIKIYEGNLNLLKNGKIPETDFQTRLIKESFYDCLNRVDRYLDFTDFAKRNDIFHLGRRNNKTLAENFQKIDIPTNNVKTFEELHKKLNLGPRRLSNIEPENIFKDSSFISFIQNEFINNGLNFDKMPSPDQLIKSHHKKESIITVILNSMEKAGYSQEGKNHEATLTGRMHDVSHAIYASRSHYLVTNDIRLYKKVLATYLHLGITTKVIDTNTFLTLNY